MCNIVNFHDIITSTATFRFPASATRWWWVPRASCNEFLTERWSVKKASCIIRRDCIPYTGFPWDELNLILGSCVAHHPETHVAHGNTRKIQNFEGILISSWVRSCPRISIFFWMNHWQMWAFLEVQRESLCTVMITKYQAYFRQWMRVVMSALPPPSFPVSR